MAKKLCFTSHFALRHSQNSSPTPLSKFFFTSNSSTTTGKLDQDQTKKNEEEHLKRHEQIKFSKGQRCPVHQRPAFSRLHSHQASIKCSRKGSAMAEFSEPIKILENVNLRLWEAIPEPVKEIPWKKTRDKLWPRLLHLGEKASKWFLIAVFIFSSFSDTIYSISRNGELLIPFGLLVGCMMADFVKEISQELFQNLKDGDLTWQLLCIGFFFALIKVTAAPFMLGWQVFLTHVGNGGLMQVLWLLRKMQEENENNDKEERSSLHQTFP